MEFFLKNCEYVNVNYFVVVKTLAMFLALYRSNSYLWSDFGKDKSKKNILQVDEEVIRIDRPVFPCSETSHNLLLSTEPLFL